MTTSLNIINTVKPCETKVLSVLFPAPKGNPETQLKHILSIVKEKTSADDGLVRKLEMALLELDFKGRNPGYAIFVGEETRVTGLNYAPAERVILAQRCALTEVLYSNFAFPEYALLTIGSNEARLFKGSGRYLVEVKADEMEDLAHLTHLAKQRAGLVRAHGSGHGAEAAVVKNMQTILSTLSDPLVLVGDDTIAIAEACGRKYAGKITGSYEHLTLSQAADLGAPAMDTYVAERIKEELARIDRLKHEHKLAYGEDDIRTLLKEGRVETLFIEGLGASPWGLTTAEELAGLTLEARANVVVLPEGSLKEGGMAAALRY